MSTIRVDKIMPFQSSSIEILGSFNGTYTGSFTGSFVGDGSGLTGVSGTTFNTSSFATTGSNVFHGRQTITGSLIISSSAQVDLDVHGIVQVSSGSSISTLTPFSLNLLHAGGLGEYRIIGLAADPSHLNFPGLENVNEPSIFGIYVAEDSSSYYYQAMEVQSRGRFAQNKVSFKVPVDVSGSFLVSGSARFTSAVTASSFSGSFVGDGSGLTGIAGSINTGSFATTGSNTFIGTEIISGSILVSGSVNANGFELDATTTTNIPALNSIFNLNLSGSDEGFGAVNIQKVLVLGDEKVLVAGRFQSIDGHITNDIARLNSNGTIDTSFTSPGFGDSDFGDYYGTISTFVTQSDGKILVGGIFNEVSGSARTGLARLNSNGTLDTSFATQSWGSFGIGEVRDIAIQNDGKIVCVGYFTSGSRRVNTDGTLDTSFNVSMGSNNPSFFNTDNFYSVALLDSGSDQAILIGGSFTQWGSLSDYDFIVKLHPSGALDSGFAGTNLNIATGDSLDRIKKIKVGDDGYIYVAGRFRDTLTGPNGRNAGFARLTTTNEGNGIGAFESSFRTYITGSDQNNPGTQYVNDFDFYDGDKILLGGSFTTFGNPATSITSANRFAILSQNSGNLIGGFSSSTYRLNTGSVDSVTFLSNDNVLVGGTFTSASFPSTAREGLASFKLAGLGDVTTTSEYTITATANQLLISSSNTYFSGDITASVISGSFVGDGSGLTGVGSSLPSGVVSGSTQVLGGSNILSSSVTNFTNYSQSVDTRISSIVTGTGFATTGSNTFVGTQQITGSVNVRGNQVITGSLDVSGSITVPGSGSLVNFVANPNTMRSIRGNGAGLFNIVEQSDGNMTFTVSKIGLGDLTGAITSNISGSTITGSFSDNTTTTSGQGRGARLRGFISGGVVTSLQIETSNSSLGYEEDGQPANRQGIGYKAGDTVTIAQSLNQVTGSLTITLRPQDIDTYFGVHSGFSFDYKDYSKLTIGGDIVTSGSITVGATANTLGSVMGNSIAAGDGVDVRSDYSIAVGRGLYSDNNTGYANATFGMHHSSSNYAQTIVGIASRLDDTGEGAFVVGNGTSNAFGGTLTRSNLLVAQGSKVQVTGSLDVSGNGYVILSQVSSSYNFANDTAAASGGVPLGGLYHTSGSIKIRLV